MQAINSSDAVAPQQGTGFIRLKDPSQMRMVLIVEAVARSGWEATFGAENPLNEGTEAVGVWEARPFSVKVKGSNNYLYRRSREMGFRPEAAKQILGEGVRRSLRLPELVDHVCDETSRTALRIGALEALWVQNETDGRSSGGRNGCSFLLAVSRCRCERFGARRRCGHVGKRRRWNAGKRWNAGRLLTGLSEPLSDAAVAGKVPRIRVHPHPNP